jgi:hydroxymethylbilane synthase
MATGECGGIVRDSGIADLTQRVRMGTRGSALALWQTRRIGEAVSALSNAGRIEEVIIRTHGDRESFVPLPDIGGQGVFTAELERALLEGGIDLAVHSLKDLPLASRPGLRIAAVCFREDVRDVLVTRAGWTLTELPADAVVGTSSARREAQLRALRPDVRVRSIRGNVETRIAKVDAGEFDAAVLAAAGVLRLGLEQRISEWLPLDTFLPAPGQGALAVQCRDDDSVMIDLLEQLDDANARACTDAERAFLGALGGGCSLPVAAFAECAEAGTMTLRGYVGSPRDGRAVRLEGHGPLTAARDLGHRLAHRARELGAMALLA